MRKLTEGERQHLRNSINDLLDSFDLLTSILPEGEQLDKAVVNLHSIQRDLENSYTVYRAVDDRRLI